MPVSVDDELDTDPELRVELPCVATPKATLPQVGKQGDTAGPYNPLTLPTIGSGVVTVVSGSIKKKTKIKLIIHRSHAA